MIIVYAAVAGQSVVKLYAAATFPGFFLAFLYLICIIGWCLINPKVAPKLPMDKMRAPISPWVAHVSNSYSRFMLPALLMAVISPAKALEHAASNVAGDVKLSWFKLVGALIRALTPFLALAITLGAVWWYVTIYSQKGDVHLAAIDFVVA
jgi:TRAP-type mannitol/chloroaromatic compound transport system permease large subunit